jgi:hypothetical protein
VAHRLRVFRQGTGVLVLFIAIAAGATYAGTRIHSSGSSPAFQQRVGVIETSHPVLDAKTGLGARVLEALLVSPAAAAAHSARLPTDWLLIRVSLTSGRSSAHADPASFYALDGGGQGYAATAQIAGFPPLRATTLHANEKLTGWIGFVIPKRNGTYTIVWTDDSHLVPPAVLATVRS